MHRARSRDSGQMQFLMNLPQDFELSVRERQIVDLAIQPKPNGFHRSNREIGDALGIARPTVRRHLEEIRLRRKAL